MVTFLDDRPKNEVDVERTDSGVGGDLGQSHLRRSWEEIVMKSSEQWSVVAASARHWQELARRRKAEQSDIPAPKKKSSAHSITGDMVCFVCSVFNVADNDDDDEADDNDDDDYDDDDDDTNCDDSVTNKVMLITMKNATPVVISFDACIEDSVRMKSCFRVKRRVALKRRGKTLN